MTTDTLTVDTEVTPEPTTVEATAEAVPEKAKRGRPVEAIAKRSAIADYRKAEEAVELLKSKGFTVEYPERWEHPDVQSRRDAVLKAIEAAREAGVDDAGIKALLESGDN